MKRCLVGEWELIKGVMFVWLFFFFYKYIVDLM